MKRAPEWAGECVAARKYKDGLPVTNTDDGNLTPHTGQDRGSGSRRYCI